MDIPSFCSAVIGGIVVWIISILVGEMITRPKLIFSGEWKKKKWVGRYVKEKRRISVPGINFHSMPNIYSTLTEIETDAEELVYKGGSDFEFYGITIKNSKDPNILIHRGTAEITRTNLILDDGLRIECRWWSRDYSENDKLFSTDKFTFEARRETVISAGSQEHIVIAYRKIGNSDDYFLFDVVSDVGDNFWNNKYPISNFPRYAKLNIISKTVVKEIFLKFDITRDNKKDLVIQELPILPEDVNIKDS